jgi:hypothetical protein
MFNKLQLLSLFVFLPFFLKGQTYEFSASTSPYIDLLGGNPAVTETWDDPEYNVPIGFVFHFYDQSISTVHQLGEVAYSLLSTHPLTDTLGFFFVFGADLIDRGYEDTTLQSPITYKTTGTPGHRVFTIEWKNAGFFRQYFFTGNNTDYVNFQMRLYEEDMSIEYHYGPSNITHPELDYDSTGAFVGLIENLVFATDESVGESLLLSGNPSNPTPTPVYQTIFINGTIPANTLYRFERMTTAVENPLAKYNEPIFTPNPCDDFLQISNKGQEEIISPVYIYNSTGTLVVTAKQTDRIETSALSPGIYQLQFRTVSGWKTQRIAVSH